MSYPNGIGDWTQSVSAVATAPSTEVRPLKGQPEESAAVSAYSSPTLDKANLSSASELVAQALATDDVRTDKVESLRAAIASGSYSVPSADIADKMIR